MSLKKKLGIAIGSLVIAVGGVKLIAIDKFGLSINFNNKKIEFEKNLVGDYGTLINDPKYNNELFINKFGNLFIQGDFNIEKNINNQKDPKSEAMSLLLKRLNCNLVDESDIDYSWSCSFNTFGFKNFYNFDLKNVRFILPDPDNRKIFIPFIKSGQTIVLANYIDNGGDVKFFIPNVYLYDNYLDTLPCIDFYAKWDNGKPVIADIAPLSCNL